MEGGSVVGCVSIDAFVIVVTAFIPCVRLLLTRFSQTRNNCCIFVFLLVRIRIR